MGLQEYKTITVEQGQENQSKEESIYLKNTFFSDCYVQARECLREILKHSQSKEITDEELSRYSDVNLNRLLLSKNLTNIITFCADRGAGKTTAMVSFAKSLEKIKEMDPQEESSEKKFWRKKDELDFTIPNYRFHVINSIDPTTMEDHDSILQMVLSRMFSIFQMVCEERNSSSLYSYHKVEQEQNELFELFQRCYHNLEVHTDKSSKQDTMDDELERMAELGDSSNLKASLYRLIRKYLKFLFGEKKGYLVIQIDDTDLNVCRAYPILEEIRKYLLLPRVVVLLAADMSQLESTVEQYFFKQYETSLKYPNSMVGIEQCHLIAEQYLEKLIPSFRRIYLPDLSKAIRKGFGGLQVDYRDPSNKYRDQSGRPLLKMGDEWPYQRQLLYYLHQKTGMMYYAPKAYLHNFLPSSMRELTHFLSYFGDMKDVEVGYQEVIGVINGSNNMDDELDGKLRIWQSNLERLEHYLLYSWASINLRNEGAYYLRQLALQPQESKHRYILGILPSYYASERMQMDRVRNVSLQNAGEYQKAYQEECEKNGVYINEALFYEQGQDERHPYASYADVLTALRILTDLPGGSRQYKFAYAVRFYYTIYLHQMMLKKCVENEPVNPADFMEDVLLRSGEPNSRDTQFAFWHIRLSAKELFKNFSDGLTQPDIAFLSGYLRKEVRGEFHYKTALLDIKEVLDKKEKGEALFSETWMFNPFYYLLYHLENLFRKSSGETMEREVCSKTEIAMMVLLNWDIQYYLLHEYKKQPVSQDEPLRNLMDELFQRSTFKNCLKELQKQNDPEGEEEKYSKVLKAFLPKFDEDKLQDEEKLPDEKELLNKMDWLEASIDSLFCFHHIFNAFTEDLQELKKYIINNPGSEKKTWKELVDPPISASQEDPSLQEKAGNLRTTEAGELVKLPRLKELLENAKRLLIIIEKFFGFISVYSEKINKIREVKSLEDEWVILGNVREVCEELKETIENAKAPVSDEAETSKEEIDISYQREFEEKLQSRLVDKLAEDTIQALFSRKNLEDSSLTQESQLMGEILTKMISKLHKSLKKDE